MDGKGVVSWWGTTPALNLEQWSREADEGPLKVLLVGGGDLRHILTTLATTSRHIHFYVAESCLELYARHILFLKLLSEPPHVIGMQEKVELFMELYGNSLLRSPAMNYLTESVPQFIRMITDLDYQKAQLPMLDLSNLKFKERDFLEGIFKFWKDTSSSFPMEKLWDDRVRSYLGVRYDARQGVFDWDCHMKLHDMTPLVNVREYKDWREGGVAFRVRREAPYDIPNRTLASGLVLMEGGAKVARRGYWGDITTSPYIPHGVETEQKELLKTEGGKNVKTSVDVTHYNLTHLIRELTSQQGKGEEPSHHHSNRLLNGSCQITLLPLSFLKDSGTLRKKQFTTLFDVSYFSNSMVHHLTGGMEYMFASNSVLILESVKYLLDLRGDKKEEYSSKVSTMALSLSYKVLQDEKHGKYHLIFARQ